MRIAYVCADPGIPVFGQKGCSIHVQEVIRALRQQGAEVELFAVRLGDEPAADLADVKVHHLPPVPQGDRAVRERVALSMNPDLPVELAQHGPFDLIYERYSLWSYGAMEFAQATGIPGILEVNAPLIEEQIQHRGLVHRAAAEQVAQRVLAAATAVVAVSEEVKHYLEQWGVRAKVRVIPNGVNPQRFPEPTLELERAADCFTIGFVGSLKPWHGLLHLIQAFARLHPDVPEARLLIVGDGPERASLERQLAQQGLSSLARFTGAVPPHAVPPLLAAMDVAVAPYPALPGFYFSPLKVVEYMAAGRPVVASRIGQLSELVSNGVTGLLLPPGDDVALASTLERLWRSPHLRQRLGQAARQHILTHHTWDAVAQQILAIAHPHPASPAPRTKHLQS